MKWQDDLERFKRRLAAGEDVFGARHRGTSAGLGSWEASGEALRRRGRAGSSSGAGGGCPGAPASCSRTATLSAPPIPRSPPPPLRPCTPAGPLIRKYLLDNGHRVTVELRPDPALGDQIEAAEAAKLAAARGGMGEADLQQVVEATKVRLRMGARVGVLLLRCCWVWPAPAALLWPANSPRLTYTQAPHLCFARCPPSPQELKERQETPDAPEALACIPSLSLSDIPCKISTIPTAISDAAGEGALGPPRLLCLRRVALALPPAALATAGTASWPLLRLRSPSPPAPVPPPPPSALVHRRRRHHPVARPVHQ